VCWPLLQVFNFQVPKGQGLRDEYTRTIEPARTLAAETLALERTLSDLVNQAYALTPAEIALMWQTAPPRMPIPRALV
jgi:diketogulonate reductase-like aldo/keto reductase